MGGLAGSEVPVAGNTVGAIFGGADGATAGSIAGETMGEGGAEAYAGARGYGGCHYRER